MSLIRGSTCVFRILSTGTQQSTGKTLRKDNFRPRHNPKLIPIFVQFKTPATLRDGCHQHWKNWPDAKWKQDDRNQPVEPVSSNGIGIPNCLHFQSVCTKTSIRNCYKKPSHFDRTSYKRNKNNKTSALIVPLRTWRIMQSWRAAEPIFCQRMWKCSYRHSYQNYRRLVSVLFEIICCRTRCWQTFQSTLERRT